MADVQHLRRLDGLVAVVAVVSVACGFGNPGAARHLATPLTASPSTAVELSPTPIRKAPPPKIEQAALAYDPATQRVMAFGPAVIDAKPQPGVTYGWNGSSWSVVATTGSIPGYQNAALASEPASTRLILFGGYAAGANSDQTWALENGNWKNLNPRSHPSAQTSPALAVDAVAGRLILFGGCCAAGSTPNGGSIPLAETWAWTGADWLRLAPAHSPPGRMGASLVWDPDGKQLVLFGGAGAIERQLYDTWTWDGADWHPQGALDPGLATLQTQTVAYDGVRHLLLLFVDLRGRDKSPGGSLWSWTPTSGWQADSAVAPPQGSEPRMTWDAAHNVVLLLNPFRVNEGPETWTWDGRTWTPRSG